MTLWLRIKHCPSHLIQLLKLGLFPVRTHSLNRFFFFYSPPSQYLFISSEFAESELYQWEVYFVSFVCALFELYVSYVLDDFVWLTLSFSLSLYLFFFCSSLINIHARIYTHACTLLHTSSLSFNLFRFLSPFRPPLVRTILSFPVAVYFHSLIHSFIHSFFLYSRFSVSIFLFLLWVVHLWGNHDVHRRKWQCFNVNRAVTCVICSKRL